MVSICVKFIIQKITEGRKTTKEKLTPAASSTGGCAKSKFLSVGSSRQTVVGATIPLKMSRKSVDNYAMPNDHETCVHIDRGVSFCARRGRLDAG